MPGTGVNRDDKPGDDEQPARTASTIANTTRFQPLNTRLIVRKGCVDSSKIRSWELKSPVNDWELPYEIYGRIARSFHEPPFRPRHRLSGLSARTSKFMVPMRGQEVVRAFHEPTASQRRLSSWRVSPVGKPALRSAPVHGRSSMSSK